MSRVTTARSVGPTSRPRRFRSPPAAQGRRRGESTTTALLDDLVRALQECHRDREAESLRGREIDDQLEALGSLYRQVRGTRTQQHLANVLRGDRKSVV